MSQTANKELIICIVDAGFSDTVMEAARAAGARGGTLMSAHGTATAHSEKRFGITVHPEKDRLMILVDEADRDPILKAVYRAAGTGTDANGIVFSLPVSDTAGLSR